MWLQNLRYVIKNFRKNKIYSILNTIGLSIGLSVVTIIVLFLTSEYKKDKNIPNYQNIYRLYSTEQNTVALDYSLSDKLLSQYPEIENACAIRTFYGFDVPLSSEKNFVNEKKAFLTDNTFFDLFDINLIQSISDKPLPDYQSVVITKSLANKLFPNENPLGQNINFLGFADFQVSAVAEDFTDKSLNCNFIIDGHNPQFQNFGQENNVTISSHYLVLNPNTDVNIFASKLNTFLSHEESITRNVGLQKLENIYLNSGDLKYNAHEFGNKKMLAIFLAISILILVLSNINNFNYNLSLQYNQLKDIGIRKTNGAGMTQIIKLFLTDSFLKVSLATLISVGITLLTLPLATSLLNSPLTASLLLVPSFVVYAFVLFVFVILLNSIAPIYIFSKFDIRAFLAKGKTKNKLQTGKSVLTVFQFVISVLLLISVVAIKKQIAFVKHADIGFNKEALIRVSFPIGVAEVQAKTFKDEITQLPFVASASLSNGVPGMVNYTSESGIEGNDFPISELLVDADFLQTMDIPLTEGRDFRKGENNEVCIINQTALKKYGWENFEEETYINRGGLDVIGISSDFSISSLHQLPMSVCLIYADNRDDFAQINIRLQGSNNAQMLGEIESHWNSMFSPVPFNFTFYDQFFNAMYQKEERTGTILSFFSILALLITCLGVLCISFQNGLSKTKEIGIRKVNGAKVSEILSMLNKDFVKWVVIAFVIATPIAYYAMNKWLENFAYQTNLSWWIFALAGLLALGIALLTVSWQSWKAATRNPVEALRYE